MPRPRGLPLFVLCLPPLVAASLAPSLARADRGQVQMAVMPLAALLKIDGQSVWGGGAALDLSVGLSDAFNLRLTGAYTAQHQAERDIPEPGAAASSMRMVRDPARFHHAYHAGLGVTYIVDILRVVPSLDFAVGLLGASREKDGKTIFGYDFGVEIGLNLDYLLTRRVSVGAMVRYHAYLTSVTEIPVYLYFGPRLVVRFNGG